MCVCVLQYALWGNKTDLSMLVDVSHMDAAALGLNTAAAAAGGSSGSSNGIIVDEFDALWAALTAKVSNSNSNLPQLPRVDIILDNAGLELYTDLVLADYLVSSGMAGGLCFWVYSYLQGASRVPAPGLVTGVRVWVLGWQ
jgi:hypothetical protein